MRTSILWRMILPVAAMAVPLQAQTPPPPPIEYAEVPQTDPTEAQKALLDQVQGVGKIKFGATVESFARDALSPVTLAETPPPDSISYFQYPKPNEITWGTLHPSSIELRFLFNHLVMIRMNFSETLGDLLTVQKAVIQKYGPTSHEGQIFFSENSGMEGLIWYSQMRQLNILFPKESAVRAIPDLDKKSSGVVVLFDDGLWT